MLRGCLAGCRFFGRIQLDGWRRVAGARIEAVTDLDRVRAEAAAAEFAARPYTDVGEMLDREPPDFLDIATRPDSHLPLVRLAAERRIAVLCQKPMANTWAEALAIAAAARDSGIRLMINENWRRHRLRKTGQFTTKTPRHQEKRVRHLGFLVSWW